MQEEVRQLVVQKVKFSTFLEFGRPNLVSPKLVYRRKSALDQALARLIEHFTKYK